MDDGMGVVMLGLALLCGLLIYFLPSLIAERRKHDNFRAIFALNLLVGWTLAGWVIALVWALTAKTVQTVVSEAPPPSAEASRACPYCAEPIRAAAIKCKHCGSDLVTDPRSLVQ